MKFFKKLLRITIAFFLLLAVAYGTFFLNEYRKGLPFVEYLSGQHENVTLDEAFEFKLMQEDLKAKQLFLVGEIHGFEAATRFDPMLFSHLYEEAGVRDYLVEMDYSQAYFLNQFNKSGDDAQLKRVLKNWVVSVGKNNEDYFARWTKLQMYFAANRNFTYHGIDKIKDVELLLDHVQALTPQSPNYDAAQNDSLNLVTIKDFLSNYTDTVAQEALTEHQRWEYAHLLTNIKSKLENTHRETVLTENCLSFYSHFSLKNKKVYGFYGLGHTLLAPLDGGYKAMATRLGEKDPWFKTHTLGLNMVFTESFMPMFNSQLPPFLRSDAGNFQKVPVSYDNLWLSYVFGIEDLKAYTPENSQSLFKLDAENSPYKESLRLFSMFKFLPVGGNLLNGDKAYSTTDYCQYVLYVRGSDWTLAFARATTRLK